MATDRIAVAQRGHVLADAVGDTVAPRADGNRRAQTATVTEGCRRSVGALPVAWVSVSSRAASTDRGNRSGDRRRVHPPPAEEGALRHRPRTTTAHPALAGRRAHRRRIPSRARRPGHPPARCPHAVRRPGRTGQQGCGLAVPRRDDRIDQRADVCGDEGRPRAGDDVPPWCRAGVLERRARSTAPCSGTASPRWAAAPTVSEPGRRRVSRCARCSTARHPTSTG